MRIRKAVLHVKENLSQENLSQPVVLEWDLIPVAQTWCANNLKILYPFPQNNAEKRGDKSVQN